MQQIDYASAPQRRPSPGELPFVTSSGLLLALLIVLAAIGVNALLLSRAVADHSWGAMYIAFFAGPATNIICSGVCLACSPIVRRITGAAYTLHILASLTFLPGIVVDLFWIASTPMHGC